MSILRYPDVVDLRLAAGRPDQLWWRGEQWRVSDTPTELRDSVDDAMLTHPLTPLVGWRFQGTTHDGLTRVFDVRVTGRGEWILVAVYD